MISSADFQKIKALIFDVDGTLTDGRCGIGGEAEIKFFDMHDLHWIKLALRAGLQVGLLSGSGGSANRKWAESLPFSFCRFDAKDKPAAFETLLKEQGLKAEECLYAGDDVVDLPVLRRAGIAAVPADAVMELDEAAPWRTRAPGGRGAACEIIRRVLKEKNLFDSIMERYRR